jgi:hypothetical protein
MNRRSVGQRGSPQIGPADGAQDAVGLGHHVGVAVIGVLVIIQGAAGGVFEPLRIAHAAEAVQAGILVAGIADEARPLHDVGELHGRLIFLHHRRESQILVAVQGQRPLLHGIQPANHVVEAVGAAVSISNRGIACAGHDRRFGRIELAEHAQRHFGSRAWVWSPNRATGLGILAAGDEENEKE